MMPNEIIASEMNAEERDSMIAYIAAWRKSKRDWLDFKEKIDAELLQKMAKVFSECRRNGFYWPAVVGKTLMWGQMVVYPNEPQCDLCTYCERVCKRKDCFGVFITDDQKTEVKKCWEKE